MKKTLIALAAAAAATGSFAQVTLTGNLDVAYANISGTLARANGSTFSTQKGNATTSAIFISATEDVGGGMKAMAFFEIDPRSAVDDGYALTHSSTQTATTNGATIATTATGWKTGQMYVGLSGGFGTIKLGAPNSPSLDVNGATSPLGTATGSGYTNNGGANTGWTSAATTRTTRSVKYESPTIGGFSFAASYAPGNDQTAPTSGSSALSILNNRAVTEVNLKYSNGPLNVVVANYSQAAQTNATGWYANATHPSGGLPATSSTLIGANYTMGNITVYGGSISGTSNAVTSVANTVSAFRGAVKANFGKVDVMAQYTEVKSNTGTSNADVINKTTGLGLDYSLSKTAVAYARFEQYDSGASSANQMNISSVGIRKSF